MEILPQHYFIPVISSFIGWLTNFIAVKLLFNPKKEKKIIFFKIQGIFPKRRKILTEKLSDIIAEELLQKDKLFEQISYNKKLDELVEKTIREYVRKFIENKISKIPLVATFLGDKNLTNIENSILGDFKHDFQPMKERFLHEAIAGLDIKHAVEEYLHSLSIDELEKLVNAVLKKEFRFIEWSGAVLGFLIGVMQLLILYL